MTKREVNKRMATMKTGKSEHNDERRGDLFPSEKEENDTVGEGKIGAVL